MIDRQEIIKSLHNTICKVVFTKANGDERIMFCTLNRNLIPQEITPSEEKKERKENPDVQAVYDVESKGWRSFRWDSVKEFRHEMNL
jgi:hypothetical protein